MNLKRSCTNYLLSRPQQMLRLCNVILNDSQGSYTNLEAYMEEVQKFESLQETTYSLLAEKPVTSLFSATREGYTNDGYYVPSALAAFLQESRAFPFM